MSKISEAIEQMSVEEMKQRLASYMAADREWAPKPVAIEVRHRDILANGSENHSSLNESYATNASLNRAVYWITTTDCANITGFLYKAADEDVAYLIGTNEDFIKDNGERIEAGRLRIGNLSATIYSEIGSGRISFE